MKALLYAALLLTSASGFASRADGRRPNVVVFIADDLGWGDLSRHGNRQVATPRLDRLAAEGASFDRFYVQPVCSPTRAEFLTGRYHPRVGVTGVSRGRERLDPSVATVADAFRDAGYATGLFGKWHNGTQPPYHPLCRGFEEYYGFTSGHWGHYFDFYLDHNNQIVPGEGYTSDDFTDHAIEFAIAQRDRPFFAVVTYNTPHSPMQVPDRWWARHAGQELIQRGTAAPREDPEHTRAALAMCENLDWNVGRLLDRLEADGLSDDTIVVFLTDNGPNGHRWNAGMRSVKGSTDEGGTRSPLFVRWPAKIEAGTQIGVPASVVDLPVSLCGLAGVAMPKSDELDGISLSPWLLGEPPKEAPDRLIYTHWGGRVAARNETHLLDHEGRLYDLVADPAQTRDLAGEAPQIAAAIGEAVAKYRSTTGVDRDPGIAPFTVGHASLPTTHLPARDATGVGNATRSNRHPNCTFFSGLSSEEDAVVWDVEVAEPGTFQAAVYLATPREAVGSRVVLRAEGAHAAATLDRESDTREIGRAEDRIPRQEGYVRLFERVELGSIDLNGGRQPLRVSIEGSAGPGPDVWLLTLTRRDE